MEKFEHFLNILFFEFNRGAKASEAAGNIYAFYGINVIRDSTARKWFSLFKEDRFDISDNPRSRLGFDGYSLYTLIHNDSHQCTRELAYVMNCDHSTIVRHLLSMGKVKKSGVWVPHVPSQKHKKENPHTKTCEHPQKIMLCI